MWELPVPIDCRMHLVHSSGCCFRQGRSSASPSKSEPIESFIPELFPRSDLLVIRDERYAERFAESPLMNWRVCEVSSPVPSPCRGHTLMS
jgi:hypothetical protein